MKNPRFTEYNDYPYDYIINRAVEKHMITQGDRDLLIEYIVDKISKGEIEEVRGQRISTYLTQWRRFITVPYAEMKYNDLLRGVAAMRKGTTVHGKPYSPDTIRGYIKAIKTFTKYLARRGIVNITRDQLEEIKYPKEITDSVKSKDLFTEEMIEKLIAAVPGLSGKALIGAAVDTGLRPVDLAGLKWRDLQFNQQRVKITVVAEKTNVVLNCYVILHKSWLVELLKHNNGASDDDYVFKDRDGNPMSYIAVYRMLQRAAKKADIKFPKGAMAKLFRVISITEKQRAGYSQAAISKMHFGTPDSKMLRHYSKYNDEDVEREAMELSGAVKMEKPDNPRPDLCPQCSEPCSPGIKFCPECGWPLTPAGQDRQKEIIEAAHKSPSYKELEVLERINRLEKEIGIKAN